MKFKKNSKCIISVILFAIAIGCNEHTTNIGPKVEEKDFGNYDISTYIPLTIGNQWIYEFATSSERAILDRRIKDTLRLSEKLLMFGYSEDVLVVSQPPNLPVSGYIGHRGGTIYLAGMRGTIIGSKFPALASPILTGHLWYADIDGRRDSFQIVSVYQGQFDNYTIDTMVIVRRWNQNYVDSMLFGRTIGIVSHSTSTIYDSTKRQLRSFSIIK
jgi:hypothetical protein